MNNVMFNIGIMAALVGSLSAYLLSLLLTNDEHILGNYTSKMVYVVETPSGVTDMNYSSILNLKEGKKYNFYVFNDLGDVFLSSGDFTYNSNNELSYFSGKNKTLSVNQERPVQGRMWFDLVLENKSKVIELDNKMIFFHDNTATLFYNK